MWKKDGWMDGWQSNVCKWPVWKQINLKVDFVGKISICPKVKKNWLFYRNNEQKLYNIFKVLQANIADFLSASNINI